MTINLSEKPRFTVITSTYNCAATLARTAQSIREQAYPSIQWIIADGGSSDGTIDVIKKNLDVITDWHSEHDEGIYDAWNKACQFIDGDWVLFLGAGDRFYSSTSLLDLSKEIQIISEKSVLCYGNVQIEKPDGTPRYISRKPHLDYFEYSRPALPHHQGVLHHRSLFGSKKPFDSKYKISADSKFMLQALRLGTISHIDINLTRMVDDGVSNSYSNVFIARHEFKSICDELDITIPLTDQIRSDSKWLLLYLGHLIFPVSWVIRIQRIQDIRRAVFNRNNK